MSNKKVFIAGHKGMVGSAIYRNLKKNGYKNILLKSRNELNLLDQKSVYEFLTQEKPNFIFIAAAKVGGIHANNTFRADFIFQNLQIACNLINGAHEADINNLCFLGSSCIYPKNSMQPIKEEYLLSGDLEPTNEPYAIAKIAGLKLCENYRRQYNRNFIALMPTNLFGPNDNYHPENSHVIPALIRRAHEAKINGAKTLTVWGSGTPMREFLYVDDLAEACYFVMNKNYIGDFLNVGTGQDISIKETVEEIVQVVGFTGEIKFDTSKPDGMRKKVMDSTKINNIGWEPKISFQEGLKRSYQDFLKRFG